MLQRPDRRIVPDAITAGSREASPVLSNGLTCLAAQAYGTIASLPGTKSGLRCQALSIDTIIMAQHSLS